MEPAEATLWELWWEHILLLLVSPAPQLPTLLPGTAASGNHLLMNLHSPQGLLLEGIEDTPLHYEPLFSTLDTLSASRSLEAIVILTVLKLCTHLKVSFPFIPGSSVAPV